ncbi:MAG: alpha/beta fold hydrolase [Bacteroidota bacterium]
MPPAPPLAYLHGWLGHRRDWDTVRTRLPGLALDLPGHGDALGLAPEAYTLDAAADAVVAALNAAGLERPVLVGYSMGGRVAMTAALRHPGFFRALVLESASPGLRSPAERTARLAVDIERAARLEADPASFLADWYRMPLFASLAIEPGRVDALVAERLRGNAAEQARALRGLSVGHQPSYWERLDAFPPTLALAGALDAKYAALVTTMGETSNVTARLIPDAGHTVHFEQPDAFVAVLQDWLATLPDAA